MKAQTRSNRVRLVTAYVVLALAPVIAGCGSDPTAPIPSTDSTPDSDMPAPLVKQGGRPVVTAAFDNGAGDQSQL